MKRYPFSFSERDRVHACPGSAVLPRDPEIPNEDAEAGSARHRFLYEVGRDGDVTRALLTVPEEMREGCASLDLDELPIGPPWSQELAVAIDVRDGSVTTLGIGIDRAYPDTLTEWHVPGTFDAMTTQDHTRVWDFKGWWSKYTPPAEKNQQWRTQAIAASALTPVGQPREVLGGLIHIDEDGNHRFDQAPTMDALDLDMELDALRADVEAVHKARGSTNLRQFLAEGDHCYYCPCKMSCPLKAEKHDQLAPVDAPVHPVTMTMMQRIQSDPAGVKDWARHVKALVAAVEAQVAEHARINGPFRLNNGKMWGPHPVEKSGPDGDHLYLACLDKWGEKYARRAVTMKATKTGAFGISAVAKMLKADSLVKTIKEGEELIESMLRARPGGWWIKSTTACGEFDPDKRKPAELSDGQAEVATNDLPGGEP